MQETASLDRSEGGLGIGLTLVKRLVDMHDGRVSVESEGVGKGARFEIAFPLVRPAQAGSPRTDELASSPKRILVVEDAEEVRESLRMLLADCAHQVTCASDGLEGLRQARELQPDVAIIDIGLPGIDGYELARRIREGPLPWSRQVRAPRRRLV
ncbi:MAG TPA: response regulator, partial [Usitatibacter sp.]|nr:response regulator [Usitatibacter sp.]